MKNWNYIEGAKTGNESIASHPDSLVAQEIYKVYLDNGKDENKALEVLASKYKNLPKEALQKHLKDAIKAYANIVRNSKTGAEEFFKQLSDDVKEREKKDDADIEKVGNAKDKNDKDIKVGDFVNVTGKKGKVTKIIGDVVEVFFDNSGTYYPDRTDRYYASECTKIGNKYKPGDEVTVRLPGKGAKRALVVRDEGNIIKVSFSEDGPEVTVLPSEVSNSKVGNSKTGNVASEYEILKQDPSKMHPMYKKAYEEAMKKLAREDEEFKKRFEKEYGVKAKNEASDDKFAYVMREFDEGKIKTPDGKVVTDPAQAKAIAYSESKKTENGLARARNAMK